MNVSPIRLANYQISKPLSQPVFRGDDDDDKKESKWEKLIDDIDDMPPLATAAASTVVWFGLGLAIDKLTGMVFKSMKQPITKSSLIINGVFALAMGAFSYFGAKKAEKDDD